MTLNDYCPSNRTLERYAWNIIRGLATFTADDIHVLETEIELQHRDRRVIGAILKGFESRGLISKMGYEASRRRENHGRPILRWRVNQP